MGILGTALEPLEGKRVTEVEFHKQVKKLSGDIAAEYHLQYDDWVYTMHDRDFLEVRFTGQNHKTSKSGWPKKINEIEVFPAYNIDPNWTLSGLELVNSQKDQEKKLMWYDKKIEKLEAELEDLREARDELYQKMLRG